jgi:hypothetical protein
MSFEFKPNFCSLPSLKKKYINIYNTINYLGIPNDEFNKNNFTLYESMYFFHKLYQNLEKIDFRQNQKDIFLTKGVTHEKYSKNKYYDHVFS